VVQAGHTVIRLARRVPRLAAAALLVVGCLGVLAILRATRDRSPSRSDLQLSLLRAGAAGEEAEQEDRDRDVHAPARPLLSADFFHRGTAASAGPPRSGTLPSFGQPTIVAVAGWGFEADLRLDPSDPNRIYESSPDSGPSDTSWIWRSLDGGKTFKWVPSAAPLNGKATSCAGGGDTELAVDPAGRLYFNDLSLANFSVARSDDQGRTFTCNNTGVPDTAVDRQWYALDGDPTAGGFLYLTNDEVGGGAVQCGHTTANNVLVMYRSPAALPSTAGLAFGPANHITQPGTCGEGLMGNDEVSPVATRTGQIVNGQATTLGAAVKHVYVIHDDGSLSKILVARCFPVAFGAPLTNVSDPSGLNCVDLPVADLGDPSTVRTGANFPSLAVDRAGNLYAVWEQAPYDGAKAGDTTLMYAYSTNEGTTWSRPIQIPTPGLANNVFAWAAAGDDGRVDIAWVGTAAHVDLAGGGPNACDAGGPDSVGGSWSLYLTQTLNGHAGSVSFTTPLLVGEHPLRRGSIQTVMGDQCGGAPNNLLATNRSLGDFFQLRIGSQGEAQVSYADSQNVAGDLYGTHAMYARQVGGSGVFASQQPKGDSVQFGSVSDPPGDATYDALGVSSASMPNLDIVSSKMSYPKVSTCHPAGTPCVRVAMTLANLSTAAPAPPDTDRDLVWLTQWLVPADPACASAEAACVHGGANFVAYAESPGDGTTQCWVGQNAVLQVGNGIQLTYPGTAQITAPGACAFGKGPNGSITIDVPLSQVSLDAGVAPYGSTIYSVTASTMTLPEPANSVPSLGGVGGVPFNLVDVARGYDVKQ
jgi:hypothetical protein